MYHSPGLRDGVFEPGHPHAALPFLNSLEPFQSLLLPSLTGINLPGVGSSASTWSVFDLGRVRLNFSL